jgi:hypothetical protein
LEFGGIDMDFINCSKHRPYQEVIVVVEIDLHLMLIKGLIRVMYESVYPE